MQSTVIVATASSLVEASAIRALLDAHGIGVTISGEHHAQLLGGLAGVAIPLHVRVRASDAAQATALIAEFRSAPSAADVDPADDSDTETAIDTYVDTDLEPAPGTDGGPAMELRRRRQIAALAACGLTFGMGHLAAGRLGWAILLAAVEIVGLYYLFAGHAAVGASLALAAITVDIVGSQRQLSSGTDALPQLPPAQTHARPR